MPTSDELHRYEIALTDETVYSYADVHPASVYEHMGSAHRLSRRAAPAHLRVDGLRRRVVDVTQRCAETHCVCGIVRELPCRLAGYNCAETGGHHGLALCEACGRDAVCLFRSP